jgi:hypothetical protein
MIPLVLKVRPSLGLIVFTKVFRPQHICVKCYVDVLQICNIMTGRLRVDVHLKYSMDAGQNDTFIVPPETSFCLKNEVCNH